MYEVDQALLLLAWFSMYTHERTKKPTPDKIIRTHYTKCLRETIRIRLNGNGWHHADTKRGARDVHLTQGIIWQPRATDNRDDLRFRVIAVVEK